MVRDGSRYCYMTQLAAAAKGLQLLFVGIEMPGTVVELRRVKFITAFPLKHNKGVTIQVELERSKKLVD
jgi:hypothetical protein